MKLDIPLTGRSKVLAERKEGNQLNWPRWQMLLLIAVLAVLIVNRMTILVDTAAYRAGLLGEVALDAGRSVPDPGAPAGFGKMVEVDPDGAYAKAGIRNGDHVLPDPAYQSLLRPIVGEMIHFTLDRGGVRSEHHIIVEALPAGHEQSQSNGLRAAALLAVVISMLVGCFILWRGWGNATAMLLGAALVTTGRGGASIPAWASDLGLAAPMYWWLVALNATVAMLIPFAFRMFEQQGRTLPRWHWQLFTFWFIWCLVSMLAYPSDSVRLTNYFSWAGGVGYGTVLMSINIAVAISYLIAAWRNGSTAERNRIALIVFALSAYLFAAVLNSWDAMRTGMVLGTSSSLGLFYFNAVMQGFVAYAVLRHKLFDLGFAVNRTLVYGTVSAVLLVSVGLLEYTAKSLVPKIWLQGSVFISAGIAVGLFLIFHRIHHSVEHAIERLFFHKWQVNEAALRRFVRAAAHVEKPEALAGQFESELTRFSGGAGAMLYTRSGDGTYASATGNTIDADDHALSAMRAEQGPVVPTEVHSPLPAALALPMMHQAALSGFVLLGPKPTGEDYRPDEVEVLGWATQQIGLDLQAIRVRELEQSSMRLVALVETLNKIVTDAALAGTGAK
jgi:hypothetical protein